MLEKIESAHEPVSRARDDGATSPPHARARARDDVTDTPHARARDDGTTPPLRARVCKICRLLAHTLALDR
jgi:hypothetical protein